MHLMHLSWAQAARYRIGVAGLCAVALLCAGHGGITARSAGPTQGDVRASRGATLAPLRTVRVGQNPVALAVDARGGHVFVVGESPLVGASLEGGQQPLPRGRGDVAMVDEATVVVRSTAPVGQSPAAVVVDAPTGRVFVYSTGKVDTSGGGRLNADPTVSVLDAATGALLRTVDVRVPVELPSNPTAPPRPEGLMAVDPSTGRVFVAAPSGLLVLDGKTGLIRRHIDLDGAPSFVAVGARAGRIYVGDASDARVDASGPIGPDGGFLAVLDLSTGRALTNTVLVNHAVAAAVDERANRVAVVERAFDQYPAFSYQTLDATSGAVVRTTIPSPPMLGDPACTPAAVPLAGRALVVCTPGGGDIAHNRAQVIVYVFDARSGRLVRTVTPTLPTITPTEAVARVAGSGPYFYQRQALAVDERDGRIIFTATVGAFYRAVGSVLCVFAARDGRALRCATAGMGPRDVAVDGGMRRAFITDGQAGTLDIFDAARL